MVSRDIGCAKVPSPRGRAICGSVSDAMEWTWLGHAIVSPGWRLTWGGLRRVWCREGIGEADLGELEMLRKASDWRLANAADDLIRLIENRDGKGAEPKSSLFSPQNPRYILRGECDNGSREVISRFADVTVVPAQKPDRPKLPSIHGAV